MGVPVWRQPSFHPDKLTSTHANPSTHSLCLYLTDPSIATFGRECATMWFFQPSFPSQSLLLIPSSPIHPSVCLVLYVVKFGRYSVELKKVVTMPKQTTTISLIRTQQQTEPPTERHHVSHDRTENMHY